MKKAFLISLILFPLLCSCWDYTELNMQNYVLGMSVDYINGNYKICIETVKITGEPQALSASDGVIIESSGKTIYDAVRNAIMSAGKKLYWGHAQLLIISEEIAQNHLLAVCDVLSRSQDIYSNINICVARNTSASEVLNADTPRKTLLSEHITNILQNEEPSHRFCKTQLWQLERSLPYTLLPTIHLEEFPVVEGSAVISDTQLRGFLNGDETQIFLFTENSGSGGYLPNIQLDENSITLEVLRYKTTKLKGKTRLDVIVSLSSADTACDVMDKAFRDEVESAAEKLISGQINSLTKKPFGNPLPDLNYNVNVELNSSGLLRKS